jgi:alkylated DNA repair dioxygenase AlkB
MEHDKIKGLYYIENYLTNNEQTKILKFLNDSKKWKSVGNGNSSRKVIQYGHSYAYDRSGITKIEEIPKQLLDIVDLDRINIDIGLNMFDSTQNMEQLIINEYVPGQGIFKHIDRTEYFGPIIICVSVGNQIDIEFSRFGGIDKEIVKVKPGSMYIMSGDSRYKWKHGIKKAKKNSDGTKRGIRYSLTYRTIVLKD